MVSKSFVLSKTFFTTVSIAFLLSLQLTGCSRDPDLVALAPSGLRYPNDLILKKNRSLDKTTPTIDQLNRHKATYAITEGSLPQGLEFNPEDGSISGTPIELLPETYITVTATTRGGSTSARLKIVVSDLKAEVSYPNASTCTMFTASTLQPQVDYQPAGTQYSLAGSVPGISIDPRTGVITCNVTQWPGSLGQVQVPVVVTSPDSPSETKTVSIQVTPVTPVFSYPAHLPAVQVGNAIPSFSATQTHPANSGVLATNGYSLQSCSAILEGQTRPLTQAELNQYVGDFEFNASNGQLSGTPHAIFFSNGNNTASLSCVVQAQGPAYGNQPGLTSTATFSFDITAPAPTCNYSNIQLVNGGSINARPTTTGIVRSFQLMNASSLSAALQSAFQASTGNFSATGITQGGSPQVKVLGPNGVNSTCGFSISVDAKVVYPTLGVYKNPSSYQSSNFSSAFQLSSVLPTTYTTNRFTSATGLPAGASFSSSNGSITGLSASGLSVGQNNYDIALTGSYGTEHAPLTIYAINAPKVNYANNAYVFYVKQNGSNSTTIPLDSANSTQGGLLSGFTVSPASGVGIDSNSGALSVNLQNASPEVSYTVCAGYSSSYVSANALPAGVKDCTTVKISVVAPKITYAQTSYNVNYNSVANVQPNQPTVQPSGNNTFSASYSYNGGALVNGLPPQLGISLNSSTGIISSNSLVVTSMPGNYTITVTAANSALGVSSSVSFVYVIAAPTLTLAYLNPQNTAYDTSTNPWKILTVGSMSPLLPTVSVSGTGSATVSFSLSSCNLSSVGLTFNVSNGSFNASPAPRSAGEVTCVVTAKVDGTSTQTTTNLKIVSEAPAVPRITYINPNTWGTQGLLSSTNPWYVSNQGNVTLNPVIDLVNRPAPTGYTLTGCTAAGLSSIGLQFNSQTGVFSNQSATRALGEQVCTVTPYVTISSVQVQGSPFVFKISSSEPKIVVVGLYDAATSSANLVQNVAMSDNDQANYGVELDAGKVTVGAEPKPIFIKVKNIGNYPATGVNVKLPNRMSYRIPSDNDYSITSPSSYSFGIGDISVNQTSWVQLKFLPSSPGWNRISVTLDYKNNGGNILSRPLTSLKGLGVDLFLSSSEVDFGIVPLGTGTSLDRWMVIQNNGDTPVSVAIQPSIAYDKTFEYGNLVIQNTNGQSVAPLIANVNNSPKECVQQNKILPHSSCSLAIYYMGKISGSTQTTEIIDQYRVYGQNQPSRVAAGFTVHAKQPYEPVDKCANQYLAGGAESRDAAKIIQDVLANRPLNGVGAVDKPITISDYNGINEIANKISLSNGATVGWRGLNFLQCRDLNVPSQSRKVGIGTDAIPFLGSYDGAYKKIALPAYDGYQMPQANSMGFVFNSVGLGAKVTRINLQTQVSNQFILLNAPAVTSVGALIGVVGKTGNNALDQGAGRTEISFNSVHAGVIGGDNAGGIVGELRAGVDFVSNQFYGFTAGKNNVGGSIGLVTAGSAQDAAVKVSNVFNAAAMVYGTPVTFGFVTLNNDANASAVGGIIGRIQVNGGNVQVSNNFSLAQVKGKNTSDQSGVGGMIGAISGGVSNINSTVQVQGSYVLGGATYNGDGSKNTETTIQGIVNVGGFIGNLGAGATISGSSSYIKVTTNTDDLANNTPKNFGGFAGKSSGNISQALAYHEVTYWDGNPSSANSALSNHENLGGFVGYQNGGQIKQSVAYNLVKGAKNVGGFVGKLDGGPNASSATLQSIPATMAYILGSVSYGAVSSSSNNVGGFAGDLSGPVLSSVTFSPVLGVNNTVGGFCGNCLDIMFGVVAANPSVSIQGVNGSYTAGVAAHLSGTRRTSSCAYWGTTDSVLDQFLSNPYQAPSADCANASSTDLSDGNLLGGVTRVTPKNDAQNLNFVIPDGLLAP